MNAFAFLINLSKRTQHTEARRYACAREHVQKFADHVYHVNFNDCCITNSKTTAVHDNSFYFHQLLSAAKLHFKVKKAKLIMLNRPKTDVEQRRRYR